MNALAYAAEMLDPTVVEVQSHATWCKANLPHMFPLAYGPHHHWLFDRIGPGPRGVRAFAGAARGGGKTSAAIIGTPLSCIAQGTHRFVVVVRVNQTEAENALAIVRSELDRNEALSVRYPRLRYSTRGVKREKDHQREIHLAGGIIVALGAGGSLRGLIRRGENGDLVRPDLFVFDDLEDAEQARSKLRTDRQEEWLFADVSSLGGPAGSALMDVVGIGTTLDSDALATRAIKGKGRFRTWQTAAFPAEYLDLEGVRRAQWPEGQPLAFLDRLLDPDDELFLGAFTYAKEYLLDPRSREDTLVKREHLRYGTAPADLRFVALGVDPAASTRENLNADYSAVVVVGVTAEGDVWVTRKWRARTEMQQLFDQVEAMHTQVGGSISFEAVAGFRWGLQELRRRMLPHRGVQPKTDKVSRFQPIAIMYQRGAVWHDDSLRGTDFEDELLDFPGAANDDYVDALYLAVMLATNDGRRARRGIKTGEPSPLAGAGSNGRNGHA